MTLFPVFLRLEGRHVLVVGAGPIALSKISPLLSAGARVTVVAPDVHPGFLGLDLTVKKRPFDESDLDGVHFVVAAAPPETNREVVSRADARGLFVNAVDDVRSASAYLGGIVRKHGVTLAISTDGRAPALAGLLREAFEALLPNELDEWVALAERMRIEWKKSGLPMPERRPALLRALIEKYGGTQ